MLRLVGQSYVWVWRVRGEQIRVKVEKRFFLEAEMEKSGR